MRRALILVLLPAALAACSAGEEEPPPFSVQTPLSLDPTDRYELPPWWTNGRQLLHLDPGGVYRLYEGTNRHHPPAERGNWSKQSYATIWLFPYAQRGTLKRGALSRERGELVLEVGDLDPMIGTDAPPLVMEDRLVGEWTGEAGTLRLEAGLRYSFLPRAAPAAGQAWLASQEGAWLVEDEYLILQPYSTGVERSVVRIRDDAGTIALDTTHGTLRRRPAGPGGS